MYGHHFQDVLRRPISCLEAFFRYWTSVFPHEQCRQQKPHTMCRSGDVFCAHGAVHVAHGCTRCAGRGFNGGTKHPGVLHSLRMGRLAAIGETGAEARALPTARRPPNVLCDHVGSNSAQQFLTCITTYAVAARSVPTFTREHLEHVLASAVGSSSLIMPGNTKTAPMTSREHACETQHRPYTCNENPGLNSEKIRRTVAKNVIACRSSTPAKLCSQDRDFADHCALPLVSKSENAKEVPCA